MLTFSVSESEHQKAKAFIEQCNAELVEAQRKTMSPEDFEKFTDNGRFPYSGAVGGGYKYIFCPTSIGVGVIIRCDTLNKELDVTDYDLW